MIGVGPSVWEAVLERGSPADIETLHCRECGNDRYFIQTVSFEANLVDRHMDHIRLLEAEVDHYSCAECGAVVGPAVLSELDER